MKRKKLYYLSVLITFIILPIIAYTIDSYALTFFDNEEEFLFSAPIANTESFDENAEGILPFTFSGTIFDDDIADPRLWRIASQPYGLGIPTTSIVLFTPGVQDDYFSFGTNNYVNAFGFFIFHPYDQQTIGGLINIDVIEIDDQVSTYVHDQDGQWLFFGFISDVGISQIKVYNSTGDGILDTNFAYDNISRTEIFPLPEPVNIDIKPGRKCPNRHNINKREFLKVAILGTEDFDITAIDRASIRLEGVPPIRSRIRDVGSPVGDPQDDCDCTEEGADGIDDLWLKFCTQEIVDAIGDVNHREQVVLTLKGELTDGTPIEGQDCLVIIDRH